MLLVEGELESLIVVRLMLPMVVLVWPHVHQLFLQVALMFKRFTMLVFVGLLVGRGVVSVVKRLWLMKNSVCRFWLKIRILVRAFVLERHRLQDIIGFAWI